MIVGSSSEERSILLSSAAETRSKRKQQIGGSLNAWRKITLDHIASRISGRSGSSKTSLQLWALHQIEQKKILFFAADDRSNARKSATTALTRSHRKEVQREIKTAEEKMFSESRDLLRNRKVPKGSRLLVRFATETTRGIYVTPVDEV
uniref:Terminase_6C domain-containing protein n=1 Tax=Steinernema glaseri TaxID=37863 RepID=A0A1I7ZAT3_9BILA